MQYPYCLYNRTFDHSPVFPDLLGVPLIVELCADSSFLEGIGPRDQTALQQRIEQAMDGSYTWAVSPYLEDRRRLLADCPQMVEQERYYHLGFDVIVEKGRSLHAPLAGEVAQASYESGAGNYGGYVLLRHSSRFFETFYSLYGHLSRSSLPREGTQLTAGQAFAEVGDFPDNGHWFYHTHIQVLTERAVQEGFVSKGYCTAQQLQEIFKLCPSPYMLFRT